jgi:hypothetical protein
MNFVFSIHWLVLLLGMQSFNKALHFLENSCSEKVESSIHQIKHHSITKYKESAGTAPPILNLGTRCMWAVSFRV